MASFYNRDAFSDLMSQIATLALDSATGHGMAKGSTATNYGGAIENIGNVRQQGAGKSNVGMQYIAPSYTSSSYSPTAGTSTEGDYFTNLFNLLNTPPTDANAAMAAFQSSPFTTGLNPNVVMANYNLLNSGVIDKGTNVLPSSRSGTDYISGTSTGGTGALPTSTSTVVPGRINVTGQSGAGGVNVGGLGSFDNLGGTITTTGTRGADDALKTNLLTGDGGTPTEIITTGTRGTDDELKTNLLTPDITEIVTTGTTSDDEEKNLISSLINSPLVNTLTGGTLEEILSLGKKIKNDGLVATGLGALGLDNIDIGEVGGDFTFDESSFAPYVDPRVGDFSGVNDTTTAGTGGAFDIANLAAIRSAVPGTYDPNRRAGSGGQRYFSDVQYAPQGGIAGSQAAANAQAMMLAYQNAMNPAYQVRPGATVDRATSMAQRAAGLAGLIPSTVTGTIPAARTTTGATTGTTGATTGTTGATTGTTGATTGTTTSTEDTTGTATSPYTYTSESLFQGIDPSDGFDEAEIGRVAALMNQKYTTADQVGEFFGMEPDDINRYLGDYNKRTELIKDLGLTEGQEGFTFDQLSKLGASGLENQYLADTFGVDADALQRAIGGASTITGLDSADGLSLDEQGTIASLLESGDVSVGNVASLYGITPEEVQAGYSNYKNTVAQNAINETIDSGDFDAIAELVTSNKAGIGDVAGRQGVEGMDVVEQLLRGGYETPAEMVERLAAANEGLNEEKLIANLLEEGRATPKEISSYYGIPVEAITKRYTELGGTRQFAQGGDVNGFYLGGTTDGMADQIPATINNMQPAALSDGEFVIPADVVSHLGNGNSDAGAKELYSMMDRIRKDRTGTTKQGRQIDPNKYLA